MNRRFPIMLAALSLALAASAAAQSSSLFVNDPGFTPPAFATAVITDNGVLGVRSARQQDPVAPQLRQMSLLVVPVPEPRTYKINDLLTIILRESTTADIDAKLETEKGNEWKGEIKDFPQLNMTDLLNAVIKPNDGASGTVKLDVAVGSKFDGEGDYSHSTAMTSRLTARIVDVKPNGLLVLEARKFIENDKEVMDLVVTGTCSVDSIAADNTILSSDLYDLHVSHQHKGELRKATKKGFWSHVMDVVFNF